MNEGSIARGTRTWDAVLFDLDGTLADSVGLILECFRHAVRTHLAVEPDEARWLASLGRPLHVQFAGLVDSAEEVETLVRTYVAHQRLVHDDFVRPFPGVAPVLDRLAAGGTALAVVTSKRREMALRTLRRCGFEDRFRTLITPEDVRLPKPDGEPVRAALRDLGVTDPGRALMVGDAPVDVLAGRAAGVRTAAALWGPFSRAVLEEAGADWFLAEPADLLSLS